MSDTFALCIPALNEAVGLVTGVYPNNQHAVICKTEIFGRHFGLLVSSWLIVFFSVERTLTVLQPLRKRWWDKRQNSLALICVIFTIGFLLNAPYPFVYDIERVNHLQNVPPSNTSDNQSPTGESTNSNRNSSLSVLNDTASVVLNMQHKYPKISADNDEIQQNIEKTDKSQTKMECSSDPNSFFHFYNWYHVWLMDFVLIFVVPFIVITTCNGIVIYFIAFYRNRISVPMGSRCALAVTKRALAVSVMHCITTGPFSVFVLIPGLAEKAFGVRYSTEFYLLTVTMIFAYSNHGINFILYSVFGSDFRRDCAELFRLRPNSLDMSTCAAISQSEAHARKVRIDKTLQN